MAALVWGTLSERFFETGLDRGVLYLPDVSGVYDTGFAWNGLVKVDESPTGAESTSLYADNAKYINLVSAEEFEATVEAYTYPDEFAACEGYVEIGTGAIIGQQQRSTFGLCYRTRIGNAVEGDSLGYKLHFVYGCSAAPTERSYNTVNDNPEAATFSWSLTTTPVPVTGASPTATLVLDSRTTDPADLAAIELILYGDGATEPKLPTPDEITAILTP